MKKKILLLIFGMFILVAGMVSFFALDLTPSLTSYYKLDGTSGDVIDSHGTNDGTNNGATRGETGKINDAFDFDGSNDYIQTPNIMEIGTGNFSTSMWVKASGLTSNRELIANKDDYSGEFFRLRFKDTGKINVYIENP